LEEEIEREKRAAENIITGMVGSYEFSLEGGGEGEGEGAGEGKWEYRGWEEREKESRREVSGGGGLVSREGRGRNELLSNVKLII